MGIISKIINIISELNAQQITLFSIFVTFILYVLGKNSEIRLKKHELKKEPYLKLIKTFENIYVNKYQKNKDGSIFISDKDRENWFNMGSSLLIYGSKKVYKMFVFFRNYESNPIIEKSKYKDEKLSLFLFAQILNQIRKEIGLNAFEGTLYYDSLAFFVNDISNNPVSKASFFECRYKLLMIKLELFFVERIQFIYFKQFYYYCIKPIFGMLKLIIKYFVLIQIGRIILKFFPKLSKKILDDTETKKY